jgi:hypothetical protein
MCERDVFHTSTLSRVAGGAAARGRSTGFGEIAGAGLAQSGEG